MHTFSIDYSVHSLPLNAGPGGAPPADNTQSREMWGATPRLKLRPRLVFQQPLGGIRILHYLARSIKHPSLGISQS